MKTFAKNTLYRFAVSILLIASVPFLTSSTQAPQGPKLEGTISISGAFALYPLAVKWGQEFTKLHPNVKFEITAGGAGKGMTDVLTGQVDLGAVSREIYPEEIKKGAFAISVAKDAVVPTVNAGNPNIDQILQKGIKKDMFTAIFIAGTVKNWKQAGFSVAAPINVYTRSDAAGAAETWAKYMGKKQEDIKGVAVYGDPGLLGAVKKDKLAIGFNNIGYAYDSKTKQALPGVKVIPLDLNNNGKIDEQENFYGTIEQLKAAIAAGKFPSPPARELYFVTKNKPTSPLVKEFLKFVLNEGQKQNDALNYIALSNEKLGVERKKVD